MSLKTKLKVRQNAQNPAAASLSMPRRIPSQDKTRDGYCESRPVRASDITPALDSKQFWARPGIIAILHVATRTLCAMPYIQQKIFAVALAHVSSDSRPRVHQVAWLGA